jgi:hypothetical protein
MADPQELTISPLYRNHRAMPLWLGWLSLGDENV